MQKPRLAGLFAGPVHVGLRCGRTLHVLLLQFLLPWHLRPSPSPSHSCPDNCRCFCAVNYEACQYFQPYMDSLGTVGGVVSQNLYDSLHSPLDVDTEFPTCNSLIASGDYTCQDNFCHDCTSTNDASGSGASYSGYCDETCGFCSAADDEFPGSNCMQSLITATINHRQRCPLTADGSAECGSVIYNPPCYCEDHVPGISNECSHLVERGFSCDMDMNIFGHPGHTLGFYCQISCGACVCPQRIMGEFSILHLLQLQKIECLCVAVCCSQLRG